MKKILLFIFLVGVGLVGYGQKKDSVYKGYELRGSTSQPAVGIGNPISMWSDATGAETYRINEKGDTTWLNRWKNANDAKRGLNFHFEFSVYDSIGKVVSIIDDKELIVVDSLRAIKALLHELQRANTFNYKTKNK